MKVLLIHEHGRSHGGGAVTAMYRLHRGLLDAGVQSTIACRRPALDEPEIVELPASPRLEHLLGKLSWRIGLNDVHCVSSFKIKNFQPFLDADVVNIHGWHTNYFNYLALPGMAARKPIVGTMHDMWSITGHCSQSYECERFRTGCGNCPHPEVFPPIGRDATALEWKLKRRVYRKSPDVTFVAPSRWLLERSKQGLLAQHDVRQISNAVDGNVFRPLDKIECRKQLGLPLDRHLIMFISVALHNHGKGGDLLVSALAQLPPHVKEKSTLVLLGERGEEFVQACGMPAIALGYIHEDERKAPIYAAADVLVQPSRAENQSLVIIEAMACGLPVVAFDVGGNAELLTSGIGSAATGVLAHPERADELAQGIALLLTDESRRRAMGAAGREAAMREYSLDLHVLRYLAIFEEKIHARRHFA